MTILTPGIRLLAAPLALLCACSTPAPTRQAGNEAPANCERVATLGSNIPKMVCTTQTEEERRRNVDIVRDAVRSAPTKGPGS